jgi:uncharacterized membrane protein (Fun14 family)
MEFLVVLTFIMLIFLFLFTVISQRRDQLLSINRLLSAKETADSVAWNINEAFIAGYGTKKSIYLPNTLADNTNFSLKIIPKSRVVEIRWQQTQYLSPIVTSNITGNLTLAQGRLNITNSGGKIILEE